MKQTILTWLRAGANAEEGVQLLIEAGAPSLTLRLIKSNPVANRRLMIDWLCKNMGLMKIIPMWHLLRLCCFLNVNLNRSVMNSLSFPNRIVRLNSKRWHRENSPNITPM